MSPSESSAARRNVLAGTVGSVLEWYDFALYGYLAPIIGTLFFPANDPVASLLAAFGVFAIGFAARPVGGVVFGLIGDRIGRKPALIISVVMMGVATFAIGVMPDHAQIGASAALVLVILRILEGLSVGGEYTGSIILLAEHAPPERRGYFAVWPELGCLVGFLLGSGIGALTSSALGPERMLAWGWRVPFLLGGVIAVGGIAFRRQMTESPALSRAAQRTGVPAVVAIARHWRAILRLIGVMLMQSVGFYLMFIYAASYLTERMHVSTARALDINTLSLLVMLVLVVPSASLSDRVGRKPVLQRRLGGHVRAGLAPVVAHARGELRGDPRGASGIRGAPGTGLRRHPGVDERDAARRGPLHRGGPRLQPGPRHLRGDGAADRDVSGRANGE